MIDISNEQLVPLREVPELLPPRPTGKKVHISAVYRWSRRGIRGVRLDVITIGGTTYTSKEALQRFGDGYKQGTVMPHISQTTPRSRRRQIDQAARQVGEILRGKSGRRSAK